MSGTDRGRKRSLEVTGGPAQAAARSMLRAMGWTTDDLKLPQAGVAASWNAVTPCNMHLDELAWPRRRAEVAPDPAVGLPHDLRLGRHRDGDRGNALVTSLARLDRRLGRARRPRRADGRSLHDRGLRQDPPGDDAGDDPARSPVRIRVRRLDQAGLLPRQGRVDPGRVRGHRCPCDRQDEPRRPDGARVRRAAGQRLVREHVHGEHDGEHLGGARADGARDGIACCSRPGARGDRAARRGDPRGRARERPPAVHDSHEGVIRERDDRRRRTRRLDERMPARAGARGGGGHRVRARRYRQDLAPHAADRRDAAGRTFHDAGPPRRGWCPGRDARTARRRSPGR